MLADRNTVLPVMQSERCNPVPIRMIPELLINQQGFWTLLKWDPSRVDATAQPKERRKSPRFSTACPVAVGQSSKKTRENFNKKWDNEAEWW